MATPLANEVRPQLPVLLSPKQRQVHQKKFFGRIGPELVRLANKIWNCVADIFSKIAQFFFGQGLQSVTPSVAPPQPSEVRQPPDKQASFQAVQVAQEPVSAKQGSEVPPSPVASVPILARPSEVRQKVNNPLFPQVTQEAVSANQVSEVPLPPVASVPTLAQPSEVRQKVNNPLTPQVAQEAVSANQVSEVPLPPVASVPTLAQPSEVRQKVNNPLFSQVAQEPVSANQVFEVPLPPVASVPTLAQPSEVRQKVNNPLFPQVAQKPVSAKQVSEVPLPPVASVPILARPSEVRQKVNNPLFPQVAQEPVSAKQVFEVPLPPLAQQQLVISNYFGGSMSSRSKEEDAALEKILGGLMKEKRVWREKEDDGYMMPDVFYDDMKEMFDKVKKHYPEAKRNLLAYFWQLSDDIGDETPITFDQGLIKPIDKVESAPKDVTPLQSFLYFVSETYGVGIMERLSLRFRKKWEQQLTLADVKKALVWIAGNVTVADLQNLCESIQGDEEVRCCENLKTFQPDAYDSIKKAGSFKELTPKQIGQLLSVFKTLPTQEGVKETLEVLYGDNLEDVLKKENDYFNAHDIKMVQTFNQWDKLDMDHYILAVSEYLGKTLAYLELKQGMVVRIPGSKNEATFYQVHGSLKPKKDGVIAHLITPIDEQQQGVIHLIFRGTSPTGQSLDSGASILRDTSWKGIGRITYEKREEEVVDMVRKYLENTDEKDVVLKISGHSLGGCDTQRAGVSILKAISNSPSDSPWRKIRKLDLIAHNAPRANKGLNTGLKEALAKIEADKTIRLKIEQQYVRFFDEKYEDIVQKAGDTLLGGGLDGKYASFYHRLVANITLPGNKGIEGRHGTRVFNRVLYPEGKYEMKILDDCNEEDQDAIEKILTRNYYWNKEMDASLLSHGWWHMKKAVGRLPMKVAHFALHQFHWAGLQAARIGQQDFHERWA